jgi:hypothetical protein
MLFIPLDERVGLARIGRRGAARADVSTPDPIRRFREISAEQLTASRTGLIAIYLKACRAQPQDTVLFKCGKPAGELSG